MTIRHPVRPHLRAWREKFGFKQKWLANELGTHPSNVLRQERGEIGVDDKTFTEIARIYGITVAELSAPPADAPKAAALDRLLRVAQSLDAEGVAALASFAERLKPQT